MAETEMKHVDWELKQSWETSSSEKQFWLAMDIFIKRSHILNRRLIASEILCEIPAKDDKVLSEIRSLNFISKSDGEIQEILQSKIIPSNNNEKCTKKVLYIKKVLPKNGNMQPSFEIVLKDISKTQVSFYNVEETNNSVPKFSYAFAYKEDKLNLLVEKMVEDNDSSYQWIVNKVGPKLIKWMENVTESKSEDAGSLRLVSATEYSALYSRLKETYGKQLVKMWPESTDPLKFVYEDIGIATYLLLLWAGKPKQRFVDLGCGNGLLVYILNSEGHFGIGYDIRARKIWSMYPPSTKLEVCTIIPSSETVFPNADWLIGNHSDELTVWIPVMAARSSFFCNIFLLPCCPFEFNGKKYCRTNTSISQYSDFLSYVETVCSKCEFVVEKDKLRIPSTKRTCFVSKSRTYLEKDWKENLSSLQVFVDSKCSFRCGSVGDSEASQFKPRAEEKVRNCTQIHSDIRETIVNLVADQLLAKRRVSELGWNYGGVVDLSSLAQVIPPENLKKLKNECGGLQTLLKNYHYIFKVQSGKVEFRVPTQKSKSDSVVWKKKPCWFYQNHPNLCPLSDEHCSFIHDLK